MDYRSPKRNHRTSSSLAFAILLTSALSSCTNGEKERNYSTPERLCGHSLPAHDLATFLPPGNKVTIRRDTRRVTTLCEVTIDQKLILTTTTNWRSANDSTESFAQRALKIPTHSADEGRFLYSDFEAFGKTRNCVAPEGGQELYTAVQAVGSEHRDAEAMKRLIKSFTAEVEASQDCKADVP